MRKFTELTVLSAISAVAIFVPLNATFAGTTSTFDERFTSSTITSPSFGNGQQIQTHTRRERHHTRREQKTHHYTHVERNHHTHKHYVERNDSGDTLAAGILGLAAGAILGNVLKQPEQPQVIYQTAPQSQVVYQEVPQTQIIYEVQPGTVYQNAQQLGAADWLRYCKAKYRSFNPKTGTYRGHDGKDHFCYAPLTSAPSR
ncbi:MULTISPECIES: BA14K family protein [unclassified Bartonella]|uniref:BA14K family protein n=1 Tax=unclassified Bartonella TaxID=2645622 RepID=UPI00300E6720